MKEIGATNLIPGPNSTEMALHCGYHRGGIAGLVVAGITFIFPAVVIKMGAQILLDWKSILIALESGILVFGFKKLGSGWVILTGALTGYALSFFWFQILRVA